MGMYTHITGQVTFKPETAEAMKQWYEGRGVLGLWQVVALATGSDLVADYSEDSRSSFIPNGAYYGTKPHDLPSLEWVGDTLMFCCSLKDYGTLDAFATMLEDVALRWHLEVSDDYNNDIDVIMDEQGYVETIAKLSASVAAGNAEDKAELDAIIGNYHFYLEEKKHA